MKIHPCVLFVTKTFNSEAVKLSRMKEHVMKKHSDNTKTYFHAFKIKFEKRKTVNGLFIKYILITIKVFLHRTRCHLVAKCGEPHTIADTLILPSVEKKLN